MECTNVSFSIKDLRTRNKKDLRDRDKHVAEGIVLEEQNSPFGGEYFRYFIPTLIILLGGTPSCTICTSCLVNHRESWVIPFVVRAPLSTWGTIHKNLNILNPLGIREAFFKFLPSPCLATMPLRLMSTVVFLLSFFFKLFLNVYLVQCDFFLFTGHGVVIVFCSSPMVSSFHCLYVCNVNCNIYKYM